MKLNGLKAMVIDDSATITRAAEAYLSGPPDNPSGIVTKIARDGYQALPSILEFKPDIIFLDVTMPQSNGFQICKLIKSSPRTKDIVVVMVTSKDSIFDKARGAEAMADDYIPKPFTRDKIMAVVENYAPSRFKSAN